MSKISLSEAIRLADKQDGINKVPFSFRCNPKVLNGLRDYAKMEGYSLGMLMNLICTDFFNKYVDGNSLDIDYTSRDLLDRICFLESELDKERRRLDRLGNQVSAIRDEVNRESLKVSEL